MVRTGLLVETPRVQSGSRLDFHSGLPGPTPREAPPCTGPACGWPWLDDCLTSVGVGISVAPQALGQPQMGWGVSTGAALAAHSFTELFHLLHCVTLGMTQTWVPGGRQRTSRQGSSCPTPVSRAQAGLAGYSRMVSVRKSLGLPLCHREATLGHVISMDGLCTSVSQSCASDCHMAVFRA